jgi:hypothetical protein
MLKMDTNIAPHILVPVPKYAISRNNNGLTHDRNGAPKLALARFARFLPGKPGVRAYE